MEQAKKDMLAQKLTEAVNRNDAFCQAFVAAKDAASIQKVLHENGIEVSLNDVEEMFSNGVGEINKAYAEGELTEEQMDSVAGGGFIRGSLRLVAGCAFAFGYGCLCGVCPAATAGVPYVVGGVTAYATAGYLRRGW